MSYEAPEDLEGLKRSVEQVDRQIDAWIRAPTGSQRAPNRLLAGPSP